jgi:hypothetical protein
MKRIWDAKRFAVDGLGNRTVSDSSRGRRNSGAEPDSRGIQRRAGSQWDAEAALEEMLASSKKNCEEEEQGQEQEKEKEDLGIEEEKSEWLDGKSEDRDRNFRLEIIIASNARGGKKNRISCRNFGEHACWDFVGKPEYTMFSKNTNQNIVDTEKEAMDS